MEISELNNTLERLHEKFKCHQEQLEISVMDNCSFIIQIGALTITTDINGNVYTQNSLYPTQFTKQAVEKILQISFKNANDEVIIPKVFKRTDWHKERMNDITETIELLENSMT